MKVKLAAIAKDEAAYLPEWIFHHLYLGFDEIEILVNYTEDNSIKILDKISENYPVKYRVVDNSIIDETGDFQRSAYNLIVKETSKDIDYLMFLDIDEFWTDKEFTDNIKDLILKLNSPSAISFQWGIKMENDIPFESSYLGRNDYLPARFLKVIFSLKNKPTSFYAHQVKIKSGDYLLANGKPLLSENKAQLPEDAFSNNELCRYFVVHRVYRSQLEYVSMLGRGRPRDKNGLKEDFSLKNNRFGYMNSSLNSVFISSTPDDEYYAKYSEFIENNRLEKELLIARVFIMRRYTKVLQGASGLSEKNKKEVFQVFEGVNLPEVVEFLSTLRSKWSNDREINSLANNLRDRALKIESEDCFQALKYMKMAKVLRNKGPYINKKIKEYESIILAKENDF